MTHKPRTQDEIYDSLKESLTGKISKLTNFTDRSFNYVWTQAFSREVRELEIMAVATELAGWVDYAGGPITDEDLEELGYGDLMTAEEVNEFIDDEHLDNLVELVGVTRFEGAKATGEVTISTESAETIVPEGTTLSTTPSTTGERIKFVTTEEVETATGVTTATGVPIEAVERGPEGNLPADTIVSFDSPPIGVRGVTNPDSTTGGENIESNEELRSRAKNAIVGAGEGGTVEGVKSFIRKNIDGVGDGDVIIEEFPDNKPPFADVIVDGGLDTDVEAAIEESRPVAIRHNLIRPQIIQFGTRADVIGTDINSSSVEDDIEQFFLDLGLGENVYRDELIRRIMESDENIINIEFLFSTIDKVTGERFMFDDTQTDYRLDFTYENTNGSITVEDEDGTLYTEGTDFTVEDQTGDGWPETLVWDTLEANPDDGDTFTVTYDVTTAATSVENSYSTDLVRDEVKVFDTSISETFTHDAAIDLYQLANIPFDGSTSITDDSGDTFAEGTDYEIVDDSGNGFPQAIDWSFGGSRPDDNEDFTISYEQKVYPLQYEVVETPAGEIDDASGDVYEQDVDYDIVDIDQDDENEALSWLSNPSTLSDGEEFYVTYNTEGDKRIDVREKADPSSRVSVTVE